MRTDLERFFNPRAIAIIGASADLNTISGQPLRFLKGHGYEGKLYPVNPRYEEVAGLRCYPALAEVPEIPELALILVNAARVADVLRQCGQKGVPYVIIFSSGFSEMGGKGVALQQELMAIAREYDMGVIGPNCQGMINVADQVYAGFGSVFNAHYSPGPVSMVSQSGGFGFSVMNLSSLEGGLPFRQMVTTGNEIGVSTLDFIDYYIQDPKTEIIVGYIEGLKDARRLIEVGEKALAAGKPILMWKVGNTEQGQKAAASHTANLGGAMTLYKAAFRQAGIIQVEDIQDVVDYGRGFRCGRLPDGNRLAIITISGGAGILMTDECIGRGMQVPPLSAETAAKLREFVPSFGSLLNPVDVTAAIFNDTSLINRTLQVIVDDPNVDCVAMINASLQGELAEKIAREIVSVAGHTTKPIFVAWSARETVAPEAYAALDAARIPHYRSPVRCGRALAVLSGYAESLRRYEQTRSEAPLELSVDVARATMSKATADVSEHAAKRLLARYGIPVTREELATSSEQALAAARRIGYPVALKVQSPDIPHKTEARAVRLGLASDQEVAPAYDEVLANARAYRKDARIEGVLVQEMAGNGIEAILGAVNDPLFGPAVMFGLGGIFAEVLRDVAFRLAPLTPSEARRMIEEIKGYPVLAGARGAAAADVDALADALVRLSAAAVDLGENFAELDLNPVFVYGKGKGVKAADALIKPRASKTQN
ncbi:MAG: acetate--CoA ligase family protein [Betaproteobacteria bacterium]|nr:acetate--CoA ligase family protein [Betaproteobacteria bacterium]MDH3437169.1 acetate--CoA ligase family protein [Betaproteobacteria bacterium]